MVKESSGFPGEIPDVRALVVALDRALGLVPFAASDLAQRAATVRPLLGMLEDNGLDGESLLRYGMAARAAVPLVVALLGDTAIAIPNLNRWRDLLGLPSRFDGGDSSSTAAALGSVVSTVEAWVAHAPVDDVLLFTPPSEQDLSDYAIDRLGSADVTLLYSWLWYRSVRDDLENWPTPVLHAEYRWRSGLDRVPFAEQVLTYEGPDSAVLNDQIAYRAASGVREFPDPADALFWQLQDTALDFLRRDRYNEAAALFEFHCRRNPEDARGLNNLGFCKVPADPATALELLRRAETAGYEPMLINVYNQCCCLIQLDRLGEALDRAEYFWQREREIDAVRMGFIWRMTDGGWQLASDNAIDQVLARQMADVAQSLGRKDRAARWQERAESVAALHS